MNEAHAFLGSDGAFSSAAGVRSTVRGEPAQFNVKFGIGGDGFNVASVKLAV